MTNPAYLPKDPLGKLARLSEECAEVQKEIAKILRFGLLSYHPRDLDKVRNIDRLKREIKDLEFSIVAVKEIIEPLQTCPSCKNPIDFVSSLLAGGIGGQIVCTWDDCPSSSVVIEVPRAPDDPNKT